MKIGEWDNLGRARALLQRGLDRAELRDRETQVGSGMGGAELDAKFAKAASNIPNIDVLPLAGLNVYDVLRRKTLVLSREAVEGVNARFAEAEKA